MFDFRERLQGRLQPDDIHEMTAYVQTPANDKKKEQLFAFIFDADKRISDNAAWTLTFFSVADNEWLKVKHDEIVDEVMRTTSETKRRNLLTLLLRQPFTPANLRTDFLNFCMEGIPNTRIPVAIRAQLIRLAYAQCCVYPELFDELKLVLSMLEGFNLQPSIKTALHNVLKAIDRKPKE